MSLLQFAYNNTPHSAIGRAPIEIVYGKKLHVPLATIQSDVPMADSLTRDHNAILEDVLNKLKLAQQRYEKQANKKRQPKEFKENDLVWLRIEKRRLKSIERHPKIKLAPRYYGPFQISSKINDNAFRLDLPPQ